MCLLCFQNLLLTYDESSHWPRLTGHFLQCCFLSSWSPIGSGARVYLLPAAGLHTGFIWTSWGSSQPVSPACQVLWKTGLPLSCQLPFHLVLFTKLQRVHPSFYSGPEYINPAIWNVLYDLRKRRLQGSLNSPFTYLMERYSEGGPDFSEVCYGMICLYLNNSILSNILFECLKMFSAFWSSF